MLLFCRLPAIAVAAKGKEFKYRTTRRGKRVATHIGAAFATRVGQVDVAGARGSAVGATGAGAGAGAAAAGFRSSAVGAAASSSPRSARTAAQMSLRAQAWLCRLFATSEDGRYLFSGGHWDDSFKITDLDSGRVVKSVAAHQDVVTCVASDGDWVVTGSLDATVRVWRGSSRADGFALGAPLVLSGHDDAVTCVAVSAEMDLVLSARYVQLVLIVTGNSC